MPLVKKIEPAKEEKVTLTFTLSNDFTWDPENVKELHDTFANPELQITQLNIFGKSYERFSNEEKQILGDAFYQQKISAEHTALLAEIIRTTKSLTTVTIYENVKHFTLKQLQTLEMAFAKNESIVQANIQIAADTEKLDNPSYWECSHIQDRINKQWPACNAKLNAFFVLDTCNLPVIAAGHEAYKQKRNFFILNGEDQSAENLKHKFEATIQKISAKLSDSMRQELRYAFGNPMFDEDVYRKTKRMIHKIGSPFFAKTDATPNGDLAHEEAKAPQQASDTSPAL